MPISFKSDLTVKELVPVKLLLFLQATGDMALYPFFTLHIKSLGISLSEIGIQFAVTPVATLIATPLVGLSADRMGNFQKMLATSLVFCAIMANFILLVPKITSTTECALNGDHVRLTCPSHETEFTSGFELTIPNCFERNSSYFANLTAENRTDGFNYLTLNDCFIDCFPKIRSKVEGQLLTFVRSFAPDTDLSVEDTINGERVSRPNKHRFTIGVSVDHRALSQAGEENHSRTIKAVFYEAIMDYKFYQSMTCRSPGCEIRCPVKPTTRIGDGHHQKKVPDPASRRRTFWYYLVLRISLFVVIATEMSLLKAAILTIVDRHDSEYGFQRLWSSIAVCIVPPITGIVMDRLKASGDPDAFYPCFYVYSGFKIFMAAVALVVDLNAKAPSVQIWKKLGILLRNKEAAALLFFVTVIGSTWGFIETFIVWYLQELKASRTMIGFSFTISALSGIPFTIMAGWLERKLGHVPILIIGLACYSIRLLGYSFATTAVHVLMLETLEGITTSLLVVVITTYSTVLSTHNLVATMQATWAALHFAVGRTIGSAIGGFLMESLGAPATYRIWSLIASFSAVAYLVIYLRWFRSNELERRRVAKEEAAAKASSAGVTEFNDGVITMDNGVAIYAVRRPDVTGSCELGTKDAENNDQVSTEKLPPKATSGVDNLALDKTE